MLRSTSLGRLLALTWATAAVLALTVTVITLVLIEDSRKEALRNADNQISRLVAAAETDINRNLMSVDLILAGLQDALRPAVIPGGFTWTKPKHSKFSDTSPRPASTMPASRSHPPR